MKRLLLLVAAIGVGALAIPAGASAASGDVQRLEPLTVDTQLGPLVPLFVFDDGDKLFVTGDVECRVEDTWGMIMKAFGPVNPQNTSGSEDFQPFGDDQGDFPEEALGFGGPGSGNLGPIDQPCGEQGSEWDLVLEKLGSSNDFEDGQFINLWALAAESPTQQADPAFLGDAEVFFGRGVVEQRD